MRTMIRVVCAVAVLALVALGGCAKKNPVSFKQIAKHPAPELASTIDRPDDIKKNYAYMRNTNYRGFWDDLQRTIYIDHPSRLSPYPIVDASGNPR